MVIISEPGNPDNRKDIELRLTRSYEQLAGAIKIYEGDGQGLPVGLDYEKFTKIRNLCEDIKRYSHMISQIDGSIKFLEEQIQYIITKNNEQLKNGSNIFIPDEIKEILVGAKKSLIINLERLSPPSAA